MSGIEKRILADGRAVLYCGDCTDLLCDGVIGDVGLTVTDPPYMLGAISAGDKKSKGGTLADLLNFASWYASWIKPCASSGAPVLVLGNWRSIPVYQAAFDRAGCRTYNCIIWDKELIGPGQYLRPRYEVILLGARVPPKIEDRSASDIVSFKWNTASFGRTGHPAEKPVDLMRWCIEHVRPVQGLPVLDPFMGSGTTGVAALALGHRFIGCEIDPAHFEVACQRIEAAWRMMTAIGDGAAVACRGESAQEGAP